MAKRLESQLNNNNSYVNSSEFSTAAWSLFDDIRKKDASTAGHCMRVAEYTEAFVKSKGVSDTVVQESFYAALLHDAGKINIPDNILKSTKKYTDEEKAIMNEHSEYGLSVLSSRPVLTQSQMIKDAMEHHHTSFNPDIMNGGAPGGHISELQGEDIPEIARIIACVDVYDALTHARSYKGEIDYDETFDIMFNEPRLDPSIRKDFISFVKDYVAEKYDIERTQDSSIIFVHEDASVVEDHLLDDKIGIELKKAINIFAETDDKLKYVIPKDEDLAVMHWNTAMRNVINSMPYADAFGMKFDPIPVCDKEGKIASIEYRSEKNGNMIGRYDITAEDAERTVDIITEAMKEGAQSRQAGLLSKYKDTIAKATDFIRYKSGMESDGIDITD